MSDSNNVDVPPLDSCLVLLNDDGAPRVLFDKKYKDRIADDWQDFEDERLMGGYYDTHTEVPHDQQTK